MYLHAAAPRPSDDPTERLACYAALPAAGLMTCRTPAAWAAALLLLLAALPSSQACDYGCINFPWQTDCKRTKAVSRALAGLQLACLRLRAGACGPVCMAPAGAALSDEHTPSRAGVQ